MKRVMSLLLALLLCLSLLPVGVLASGEAEEFISEESEETSKEPDEEEFGTGKEAMPERTAASAESESTASIQVHNSEIEIEEIENNTTESNNGVETVTGDELIENKEDLVDENLVRPTFDGGENETLVYNYLTGTMGLNVAAACGVLSNIQAESGFNPNIYGDGGTSYGICQWHNSRFTRLKQYCSSNGYDYTSLSGQLHYLEYELRNYYKAVWNNLISTENSAQGAYNAGYYWCYHFEVPQDYASVSISRGNRAKNTYWPKYGGNTPCTLSINTAQDSYSINQGDKCNVTGTVSSNHTLRVVAAYLDPGSVDSIAGQYCDIKNINSSTLDIQQSEVNQKFKAATLSAGTHCLKITAVCSCGNTVIRMIPVYVSTITPIGSVSLSKSNVVIQGTNSTSVMVSYSGTNLDKCHLNIAVSDLNIVNCKWDEENVSGNTVPVILQGVSAGVAKVTIRLMYGDIELESKSMTVTVVTSGTINLSQTAVSLTGTESVEITASISGDLPKKTTIRLEISDENIISVSSSGMSNYNAPLLIQGEKAGSAILTLYLLDTLADIVLDTQSVTVIVKSQHIYSVTYFADDCNGVPSFQTKNYEEALTLSNKRPTKAGYVFQYWNTKPDGSGADYKPGSIYEENADLTLYAVWKQGSGVPGDLNGDGKVTALDLSRMKSYITGRDVSIDIATADLNGDGKIKASDLSRLKKIIIGLDY